LSRADVAEIARRIADGDRRTLRLGPRKSGGTLFAVGWGRRWMGVVYDPGPGDVVTFLPEESFDAQAAYLAGVDPETGDPRLPRTPYDPRDAWPTLPDTATAQELRDHILGCGTWQAVVEARLRAIEAGEEARWTRAWAVRELRATAAHRAALLARLPAAERAECAAAAGVADLADPLQVLAAARRAIRGLERRVAGGLDDRERAVVAAIGHCLERAGP
jgi:hypothetical protein